MPEAWTYLLVNLGSVFVPLLFSFHPKLRFYRRWSAFFPACLLTATFFIGWDIWFTGMGVWGFNERYLTGFYVVNLPLEEALFFLCIPFACTFTYHCLYVLVKKDFLGKFAPPFFLFLAAVLLVTGSLFWDKWYTSITFFATAIFLLLHVWLFKSPWLGRYLLSFLVILPFFLLTNGILTGSGIPEQVVWYDNDENMGVRVGTIPLEDFVFGFFLLLSVVTVYEWLLARQKAAGVTSQSELPYRKPL